MNRTNFAKSSGVVLDVCKNHGVWLDRGELQRVLQFVDRGGLAPARAREQQQLVEERRRLESLKSFPGHAPAGVVIDAQPSAPEDTVSARILTEVFFDAAALLFGRSAR
jgi:Zn-finger nucleic acid-binding protein